LPSVDEPWNLKMSETKPSNKKKLNGKKGKARRRRWKKVIFSFNNNYASQRNSGSTGKTRGSPKLQEREEKGCLLHTTEPEQIDVLAGTWPSRSRGEKGTVRPGKGRKGYPICAPSDPRPSLTG